MNWKSVGLVLASFVVTATRHYGFVKGYTRGMNDMKDMVEEQRKEFDRAERKLNRRLYEMSPPWHEQGEARIMNEQT